MVNRAEAGRYERRVTGAGWCDPRQVAIPLSPSSHATPGRSLRQRPSPPRIPHHAAPSLSHVLLQAVASVRASPQRRNQHGKGLRESVSVEPGKKKGEHV